VIVLQHDLTFPFARSLAQNNEEGITFPIKRFTIDKVYRNNVAGGQPRFIEEADFDIVYEKTATDRDMVPEAEVLKVALEVY
jgi:translation initiation factor 2-alpha kinase 4